MKPEIIISTRSSLPKTSRRAPIVSADQPICGICSTQTSRYTCPSCNLHYCSLTCFRSEKHADCSSRFDKKTLEEELRSGDAGTQEDEAKKRDAMMQMLKKFEEGNGKLELDEEESEEEEVEDEEGERERHELEKRLQGVHLDSLSPDQLHALLSPAQQASFASTLANPHKVTELVSQEFEPDLPWWEIEDELSEEEEEDEDGSEEGEKRRSEPDIVDEDLLPKLKVDGDGKLILRDHLAFNIIAVLLAYAYTLRTFSLTSFSSLPRESTERTTVAEVLAKTVPLLVERSTLVLENLEASIEYVVARLSDENIDPKLLTLLLHDIHTLILPSSISTLPNATDSESTSLASHPSHKLLASLSDLHNLFSSITTPLPPKKKPLIVRPSATPPPTTKSSKYLGVTQKLLFYMSFVTRDDGKTELFKDIAEACEFLIESRQNEEEARERRVEVTKEARQAKESDSGTQPANGGRVIIEEIG